MDPLYVNDRLVGELDADGNVFGHIGRTHSLIARAQADGTVHTASGELIGTVDNSGNIHDAAGAFQGAVKRGGQVIFCGRQISRVSGPRALLAGAAIVLLFGEVPTPVVIHHEPIIPSEPPHPVAVAFGCAAVLGLGMIVLALVTAAVVMVALSSLVWGGMLISTAIACHLLAGHLAASFPEAELSELPLAQVETKRGSRTAVADEVLASNLKPTPFLAAAISPGLWLGIVAATILFAIQRPGHPVENAAFVVGSFIAGAIGSYQFGRQWLRGRLNRALLARQSAVLQGRQDPTRLLPLPEWPALMLKVGYTLGGTLLLGLGVGLWRGLTPEPNDALIAPHPGGALRAASSTPKSSFTSSANVPLAPRISPSHAPGTDTNPSGDSVSAPDAKGSSSAVTPSDPPATGGYLTDVPHLDGEHFPQTRLQTLRAEDIHGWRYAGVRYAYNEIFARRGFSFGPGPIRRQFLKFSWYHPTSSRSWEQIEATLSPLERENAHLLSQRQDEMKLAGLAN